MSGILKKIYLIERKKILKSQTQSFTGEWARKRDAPNPQARPITMNDFHKAVKKSVQEEKKESKKARTTAEKEDLQKKQEAQAEEYLDYVGQDSEEKGADATISVQDQVRETEKLEEFKKQEELKRKRKFKDKEYIKELGKKLYDRAAKVDWPNGYTWKVTVDDTDIRKLALKFRSSTTGRWYGRGIKASMIPKYDLNAVHVLVTQCENTVDQLEGRMAWQQKQEAANGQGLYMPDGTFKKFEA